MRHYDYLREYTRRALSFPSDSINAFQGILQCFASLLRSEIYYGLPMAFFDSAMIWMTGEHESVCYGTFPTWCWAAWSGAKLSSVFDDEMFRFWIVWDCDDMNEGISRPLRQGLEYYPDGPDAGSPSVRGDDMTTDGIARLSGEDSPDGEGNGLDPWSNRLHPEFQRYCGSINTLTRQLTPTPNPSSTPIPLKPGTLRFHTLCASFDFSPCSDPYYTTRLHRPDPSGHVRTTNSHYYIFRDKHGIPCGAFFSDTNRADDCPDDLKGKQDLGVLAETAEMVDVHALIEERSYIERLRNEKGVECVPSGEERFGMFVAVVVEWVGEVAYRKSSQVVVVCRVAMGNAVGEEGAVWREVVLR